MEPFNFNELPEVVRQLFEKVERIEALMVRLEPKKPEENEILNIEEAAEFLKVSVGALYTKVSRQEIPYSKPGKRLYFNRVDLKEWIRQGKRKTLTEIRQESDILPHGNRMRAAIKE